MGVVLASASFLLKASALFSDSTLPVPMNCYTTANVGRGLQAVSREPDLVREQGAGLSHRQPRGPRPCRREGRRREAAAQEATLRRLGQSPGGLHASPWQRGVRARPDWPGRRARGLLGEHVPRRRSAGLNLAGPMWAAGRWGAPLPLPDTRFLGQCRSRFRPSSGSFSVLMTGAPGQALEAVEVCSLSPPLSCSNSTLSLLSPLGHRSFPFDDDDGDGDEEEDVDEDAQDSEAKVESLRGMELQGCASAFESEDNQEEQKQVLLPESSLTPWEVWFVGKEKVERDRLQQKALEELNQQLEKKKEVEEREKRKIIAEEKHKEWVQRKNEQEKEKQRQAELQEKKEIAERKFKEWLENAKNKPRPAAKSYGYANGKLTGFYSGNSYPEPAFYNPIPWKPIPMPPPKEAKALSGKKTKRPVISQPQRSSSLVTHKDRSTLCLGTLCRIQR
ncbi:coiled-coil domain-containing protein 34 isoform X2 [Camelus ferus]|uniref:Coiled-coil domain-containing protein 34 isoform X2 n=2 Tax=Camelus TaxID=9836 RepID=A0A8B7KGE1_CAMFR|nr:coiled-coil domain-containing protein 34 isoform X2 [Camelus ferus]